MNDTIKRINRLSSIITEAEGKFKYINQQIENEKSNITSLTVQSEDLQKARWVIAEVAKLTQKNFKDDVEPLVTMAIQSVFDREFNFELIFEQKRKKLECRPVVTEYGYELNPEDDMGGSILDIIGFALRVVMWAMEQPRSRNFIYLDEPFKWTGRLISKAGQMVKEVSKDLDIQVIISTHDKALIDIGDTCWQVTREGKYSKVEPLKMALNVSNEQGSQNKIKKKRRVKI